MKVQITSENLLAYKVGQIVDLPDYKAEILIKEGKAIKAGKKLDSLEQKVVEPSKK